MVVSTCSNTTLLLFFAPQTLANNNQGLLNKCKQVSSSVLCWTTTVGSFCSQIIGVWRKLANEGTVLREKMERERREREMEREGREMEVRKCLRKREDSSCPG